MLITSHFLLSIPETFSHLTNFLQHTLCFRKGVNVSGFPKAGQSMNVPVRSHLATVKSSSK